ncbi:MAG: hypothetical protein AAFQ13_02465 [Pseudomonadota bacterium]
MDYTVVVSVWAVSVAAPCVLSWLAGDIVGSARTRRVITADWLAQAEAFAVPQAGLDGGVCLPHSGSASLPSIRGLRARPEEEMSFEEQARQAERRRERREAFARMPALSDLRAHAEAIRLSESPLRDRPEEETTRFGQVSERSNRRGLTHFESSVRAVHPIKTPASRHAHKARGTKPAPQPAVRLSRSSGERDQLSLVSASSSLTRM